MTKVKFLKNRLLKEEIEVQTKPGETILDVAGAHGIPVGSNCGGVCGCSTCHVYVVKGFDSMEEMGDTEADRLDLAFDVRLESRLGCQAEVADEDLVVNISEESLKAYLDENPDVRKHFQETGEFKFVPHPHHH